MTEKVDATIKVTIKEAGTFLWNGPEGEAEMVLSVPLDVLELIPLDTIVAALMRDSIARFNKAIAEKFQEDCG